MFNAVNRGAELVGGLIRQVVFLVGDTLDVVYNCLNRHVAEVHENRDTISLGGRTQ